jgi:NADH dehydrogenase [ubiquinone] 1 alpha subcomplex assembly factor 1
MRQENQNRKPINALRRLMIASVVLVPWTGLAGPEANDEGAQTIKNIQWVAVNDTVMGGRSKSSLALNNAGELVWSGDLSLENNGGFVSIRASGAYADWSAYDGVDVIIAGAGRDVQVTAQRADMRVMAGGYRAQVPTNATGDTHVYIPFSAFVLKRFGRRINGPHLNSGLKSVGQWGLLIADKRPGPFKVVLKMLKPVRRTSEKAVAAGLESGLGAAIQRGVPVFNNGDPAGCVAIYSEALTVLLSEDMLEENHWSKRLVKKALSQSRGEEPTEAAWTLRRAIDALLYSLQNK